MTLKKIFLASDHGGFLLKEEIREFLKVKGLEIEDLGTFSEESVDYPAFGRLCAEKVVEMPESLGICVCGSGIGMSMAANKVKNARAALCNSVELATLARQHNGAQILCLGERTQWIDPWESIVEAFLEENPDENERHKRRRCQLDAENIES